MPIALLSIANDNSIRENLQQKTDVILIIFIAHFTCSKNMIFANILSEMKRILILLVFFTLGLDAGGAVSRGNSGSVRQGVSSQRVTTSGTSVRSGGTRVTSARTATTSSGRSAVQSRSAVSQKTRTARSAKKTPVVSRAVTTTSLVSETLSGTNVGAAYDKCKAAYFACMDQFCELKNDDYRRCSCSARVNNLTDLRKSLQDAGDQLNVFTENLEIVGMTAEQATAMRTPSEGENALTSDKSASATILQAIMNSIRGEKAEVAGKYSDLNSLDLSFDTVNAFGTSDIGQVIAQYNGQELYNAVYPQCRQAVKADCTDAALQRAVTAYLMGIEQDCNSVQTAIEKKQTELKGALREGSAMLDLARIENRKNHNSDDFTTCLNNVESAVLSEEVCGADYHRCLDNGEYIDVSTGAPIKGVVDFYKLQEMLTFAPDVELANQKLSKVYSNQQFVKNFENRVKKFALPALDKCTENADDVWADYLDKALLDIYYAQRSKVAEIKQGCFDFVAQCYMNADASITNAMKDLIGDSRINMQPSAIVLNNEICKDYVASCDNMFGGDSANNKNSIIAQFIDERQETDVLAACRAVIKQCFDSYGGVNYENFYSPYSGLANLDWFTLYDNDGNVVSECAKQAISIQACMDQNILEQAFGGFNYLTVTVDSSTDSIISYTFDTYKDWNGKIIGKFNGIKHLFVNSTTPYSLSKDIKQASELFNDKDYIAPSVKPSIKKFSGDSKETKELYGYCPVYSETKTPFVHRGLRPTGVATEVYNQIVDILTIDCNNKNGSFTKAEILSDYLINEYDKDDSCVLTGNGKYSEESAGLENTNVCPSGYSDYVDIQKWGACLCWENKNSISNNGNSARCVAPGCHKLTLDANGGKFADKDVIEVYVKSGTFDVDRVYSDLTCKDEKSLKDILKISYQGYTFTGFYYNDTCQPFDNNVNTNGDCPVKIYEDTTFYAQWESLCDEGQKWVNGACQCADGYNYVSGLKILDTSIEPTSTRYKSISGTGSDSSDITGLNNGDWEATFSYGTITGKSKCLNADKTSTGQYCWCQIDGFTPTNGSKQSLSGAWVYRTASQNKDSCEKNCTSGCVYFLHTKSQLFESVGPLRCNSE